jgi:8-oxo-dGTP diphosphatase
MIHVAAAIILRQDKILIARRGPLKDQAGFWEFPGGKIEVNESAESCLIREIKEELNIEVSVVKHMIDNTFDYPDKSIILKAFICKYLTGNIHLVDHDKVEWVDRTELENFDFAHADVAIVQELVKNGHID